jgi:hypothetical protein
VTELSEHVLYWTGSLEAQATTALLPLLIGLWLQERSYCGDAANCNSVLPVR